MHDIGHVLTAVTHVLIDVCICHFYTRVTTLDTGCLLYSIREPVVAPSPQPRDKL